MTQNFPKNLPQQYLTAITKLFEDIETADNIQVKIKIFTRFTTTFTALPCVWNRWVQEEITAFNQADATITNESFNEFRAYIKDLHQTALSHFYDRQFIMIPYKNENGQIYLSFAETDRKFDKLLTNPYFYSDWCTVLSPQPRHLFDAIFYLSFPHRRLDYVLDLYKEHATSPISCEHEKSCNKNKDLYARIMAANDDDEKWFDLILQSEDEQFVIQNVEERISKNLCNKRLWMLYIQFWCEKNPKIMLSVYSRYCRLHVDDMEMRQKYFQEVLRLHQSHDDVERFWVDLIQIEKTFTHYTRFTFIDEISSKYWEAVTEAYDAYSEWWEKEMEEDTSVYSMRLMNIFESKTKLHSYLNSMETRETKDTKVYLNDMLSSVETKMIQPNFNDFKYQNFSLCPFIMRHISKSTKLNQKLQKTCKYFYAHTRTAYCYKLTVLHIPDSLLIESDNIQQNMLLARCKNESLFIATSVTDINALDWNTLNSKYLTKPTGLKNLIITNTLHIVNPMNPQCFSQLFRSVLKLQMKYLMLVTQSLTLKEIQLLNQECKLISVRLIEVEIWNESNDLISIEEVIHNFPTVSRIVILCPNMPFTDTTAENLSTMERKVKFTEFGLGEMPNNFDINPFCKFLSNHLASKSIVVIDFQEDNEFAKSFKKNLKTFFFSWKPSDDAPTLHDFEAS